MYVYIYICIYIYENHLGPKSQQISKNGLYENCSHFCDIFVNLLKTSQKPF